MSQPDNHDLDVLLRSAAAVDRAPAEEERIYSDVWSRVQGSMAEDRATSGAAQNHVRQLGDREVAARPRQRSTKLATVALAIAVVGSGTAAAAAFLSTRTGQHHSGWEVEAGGSGEILNLGGTDRSRVFDEVTSDIRFAPGYESQRAWALESFPRETDSAISEEFLRSWMAGNAVCTWADAWVAADNAGDAAARAATTAVLGEAVSWKDIVESDTPAAIMRDSGELLSYRWWIGPLADAARAGNRAAVLGAVAESTTCSHHVLPVIDAAPDYANAGLR